jgi:Transposase
MGAYSRRDEIQPKRKHRQAALTAAVMGAPFKRDHNRSENLVVVASEGGQSMPRGKKFTGEQIIGKLREAEVELSRGKKVPEMCRKIGVTEQTYYRWRKEYCGCGWTRQGG